VISDMRMPQMDGATLLTQVRASWPDTTRLLLTGHSDMDAAVAAVNHGQIFRFLTKPCPIETVTSCLTDAVAQHRLIRSERELLELTLRGCVQALTDCLSLANPTAFARAARVRDLVTGLAAVLEVADPWVPEVAAVLSQLGAVVLPDNVTDKLNRGVPLAPSEQAMTNRLPAIAQQVLARIPRLDGVRDAIRWQDQRFDGNNRSGPGGTDIPVAARLLRLALDVDLALAAGVLPGHVLDDLGQRAGTYDPVALAALAQVPPFRGEEPTATRIPLSRLRAGDRIDADVRTTTDTLLVGRGTLVPNRSSNACATTATRYRSANPSTSCASPRRPPRPEGAAPSPSADAARHRPTLAREPGILGPCCPPPSSICSRPGSTSVQAPS
jgi:CheY-like chemotaxis protein